MRAEAVRQVGHHELHVLGTVRGLASEEERVAAAFDRLEPAGVALGVAPEDLEGLRSVDGGAAYEHEFSEADDIYAHYLQQFGPVALPPRDLVAAVRIARERGVPVATLDLPEVQYVETFTGAVSGWQLLLYNRRVRKLARKPPVAEDALAFHLWWDAQIRRLGGFDRLERAREAHMAAELGRLALPAGRVLVLVEAARVAGMVAALDNPTQRIDAP